MNFSMLAPITYEAFAAIMGWVGRISYITFSERHKNKHITNIFGVAHKKMGECNIYIGIFSPISYKDIANKEFTKLIKKKIICAGNTEEIIVPMYSDLIVKEDYDAASKIIYILASNRYGYANIESDTKYEKKQNNSLDIAIGGPRSNHVTKHVINLFNNNKFHIEIDDHGDDRSSWEYNIKGKIYRPGNNSSFCFILKATEIDGDIEHTYVSLFGDTSASTLFAAKYISNKNHIKIISKEFFASDFLISIVLENETGTLNEKEIYEHTTDSVLLKKDYQSQR